MATVAQIRRRIERAEKKKPSVSTLPLIQERDGTQTPDEVKAMNREIDEYECRHPHGPRILIIDRGRNPYDD